MTNYKRFISYLYFYESGKKMGNVGFARVETSDELGKVTIHCSTKVVSSKECKVYLLKRTKSMTISKQVAVANSQNGILDIKLSFAAGNIDGAEFNLRDTQGVVILYSKDNYVAAKWDDSSVSYHEVIMLEQGEELQQPIPKVEAAQLVVNEEKASGLQPRIVLVDAADIVSLGRVTEIKQGVEHKEADNKRDDRKELENKSTDDEKVERRDEKEGEIAGIKEIESIVQTKESDKEKVENKETDNELVETKESDNELVETKEVDHKNAEIKEENQGLGNLQVAEVMHEADTVGKKDDKKSIKDMIRENIKAEKEKEIEKEKENENEIVKSEETLGANKLQEEELPIDDTELKEEGLHAANYAVPNPNLWADHPSARAILNRFVRMYPFDDGEIAECVRLEPKDIGLLPMSAWVLGNNSFLLHSYCNFRHLLFAKKLTREGCVYLLMVPGAHNNREQQLAKMFGFENFKCSRRRSMRDGEFGYWYVTIHFD